MEYSLTAELARLKAATRSLNPYSNGILPDFMSGNRFGVQLSVLILILMEYSLT